MSMYRSIVVGTDGSERAGIALKAAAELAKTCGAKLHIVSAYRGIDSALAGAMAAGAMVSTPPDLGDVAQEEAQALQSGLEGQAEQFRADGVDVECHAVSGSPVQVLIDVAEAVHADCIVVGNRGMTGAKRFLGSVPNTLAHHAECAVLIVPTDGPT
jgi:nucleotide-binding universal stress UspA family protein